MALIEGVGVERVDVAFANVRFEAALVKSDLLGDDDASVWAKWFRKNNIAEEARLTTSRGRLQAARAELTTYGVAVHGASAPAQHRAKSPARDDEDATINKEQKLLKRKLPSPKDS